MDGQRLRQLSVIAALLVVIAGLWFLPRATGLGASRQPEPIELRSPAGAPRATISPAPSASPVPEAVDDQDDSGDDGADDGNRRRAQRNGDDDRDGDDAGDDDDADDDDDG